MSGINRWEQITATHPLSVSVVLINSNQNNMSEKKFPNGFTSWIETHYEVVSAITIELAKDEDEMSTVVLNRQQEQGHGGIYELSEELTSEFEEINKDRDWDGEFFDEIDNFLRNKLNINK